MDQKGTGTAYLLLGLTAFGFAGLHRFYLGRPLSGLLWLCTWGLLGIGTIIDLVYMPLMVEMENRRLGAGRSPYAALPPPTPEQAILQAAKSRGGKLTTVMAAALTGLSLKATERTLERMCKDGFAEKDVTTQGAFLYVFPGLVTDEIFDLTAV